MCGKTFTLKGGQGSERGMLPRAVEEILSLVKGRDIDESLPHQLNRTPNF